MMNGRVVSPYILQFSPRTLIREKKQPSIPRSLRGIFLPLRIEFTKIVAVLLSVKNSRVSILPVKGWKNLTEML